MGRIVTAAKLNLYDDSPGHGTLRYPSPSSVRLERRNVETSFNVLNWGMLSPSRRNLSDDLGSVVSIHPPVVAPRFPLVRRSEARFSASVRGPVLRVRGGSTLLVLLMLWRGQGIWLISYGVHHL